MSALKSLLAAIVAPKNRLKKTCHIGIALASVLLQPAFAASAIAAAPLPGCQLEADNTPESSRSPACRAFSNGGSELAWSTLIEQLSASRIILLGEVHDNPAHHRIRAQIILAMEAGRGGQPRPALVFEHIRADQSLAITSFRALDRKRRRPPEEIFVALGWSNSGWPDQRIFQPLFEAALDADLPILPGNVATAEIRKVAREGLAAVAVEEMARLGLSEPLPPPLDAALLDELEASHCGLLPRTAFRSMADAQRLRDAFMARALADAADTHGRAILLAGNGHVRADRGVPWHLARLAPTTSVLTVMFLEADPNKVDPVERVPRGPDSAAAAEAIVIAPVIGRPDPCIEMRQRFKR